MHTFHAYIHVATYACIKIHVSNSTCTYAARFVAVLWFVKHSTGTCNVQAKNNEGRFIKKNDKLSLKFNSDFIVMWINRFEQWVGNRPILFLP